MASSTRPGPNLPLINATTARKPHVGGRILRAGGGFSAVDDSGGSVRMQVSSFEYENGEIARYETEARLLEKENSLRSREEALSAREANYERQQHILEKDRVNEADLKARESIAATREIYSSESSLPAPASAQSTRERQLSRHARHGWGWYVQISCCNGRNTSSRTTSHRKMAPVVRIGRELHLM